MRLKILVALFAPVFILLASASGAYALTSKEVEKELMCQCGCTMVVDVCDCDTANQIRTKISEMMGQGKDKGEIVAYFVAQYGEKMLSAPAKKGFNLVAWVVPFVAVAGGGTGLFFLLRTWARKGREKAGAETTGETDTPVDVDEYRGRLEDELKRFKEEGSE